MVILEVTKVAVGQFLSAHLVRTTYTRKLEKVYDASRNRMGASYNIGTSVIVSILWLQRQNHVVAQTVRLQCAKKDQTKLPVMHA